MCRNNKIPSTSLPTPFPTPFRSKADRLPTNINYTVRVSKRARNLRITVYPGGEVIVTTPVKIDAWLVRRFIDKKRDWIEKSVVKYRKKRTIPELNEYGLDHFREHKAAALETIKVILQETGAQVPNRITVKRMRTRWGSCSSRGNLNFNYKIIFLPNHLQDYIIHHELCHLREMNHSPHFWALVAEKIPNYRELRKELRLS